MGKYQEILEALAKKIPKGKTPYKIVSGMDEIALHSPKVNASGSLRTMGTVEMMDPEMVPRLEKLGDNPFYIEALEAEKGYGAKGLNTLEKFAKKKGADVAYLNASPLGGTKGLSQEEAAAKLRDFYSKQGYQVADDYGTNTTMFKKLGVMAAPTAGYSMNPLDALGSLVNSYREKQGQVADAITDRVSQSFGGADDLQKSFGRMAFDPVNLVNGPIGLGLTATEMMARKGK